MVVVFAGFLFSPERFLKQFGLGLAVAIILDALVIRCLIVPAVMQLFGPRAWWLPSWIARRPPRAALERGHQPMGVRVAWPLPGRADSMAEGRTIPHSVDGEEDPR